jgi:hypothetical protein
LARKDLIQAVGKMCEGRLKKKENGEELGDVKLNGSEKE